METLKRAIKLLVNLEESELVHITNHFEPKFLKKGEFLLKEGQICKQYFFLEKGLFRFFNIGHSDENTNWIIFKNQFFTEHLSFLLQKPSTEYIEALEDSEIFCINYKDLDELYSKIPGFQKLGRLLMEYNFVRLKTYFHSMLHDTAQDRYIKLLEEQPTIFHRVPLKYIASYIGITDTSLSRIRRQISYKNHFLPNGK